MWKPNPARSGLASVLNAKKSFAEFWLLKPFPGFLLLWSIKWVLVEKSCLSNDYNLSTSDTLSISFSLSTFCENFSSKNILWFVIGFDHASMLPKWGVYVFLCCREYVCESGCTYPPMRVCDVMGEWERVYLNVYQCRYGLVYEREMQRVIVRFWVCERKIKKLSRLFHSFFNAPTDNLFQLTYIRSDVLLPRTDII